MQLKSIAQLSAYSAVLLSTVTTTVQALGINCQGSASCDTFQNAYELTSHRLNNYIQGISNNAWYNNGQQIACVTNGWNYGGICAFLQKTGGTNGQVLKQLSGYIPGHGCEKCGNVPYYYPQGDNNVDNGMLTFNYVSSPCRPSTYSGLC